jgi:hypothetical protein
MKFRRRKTPDLATERAPHGTSSQADLCGGHSRPDQFARIWDSEIVPMLRAAPGLRPIVVLREICNRHPEIKLGVRRTIERRVRRWQALNDPDQDAMFRQPLSAEQRLTDSTPRPKLDRHHASHINRRDRPDAAAVPLLRAPLHTKHASCSMTQ